MSTTIALWVIWALIGGLVIWFQCTWYDMKCGQRRRYNGFYSDLFDFALGFPILLSLIIAVGSLGLAWPLVSLTLICSYHFKSKENTEGNLHPIQWLDSKMKYLVKEIQTPRENV
jgi:hypothetical protein